MRAGLFFFYILHFNTKYAAQQNKKSESLSTLACVGATYLPGPSPAKYCGQKRA